MQRQSYQHTHVPPRASRTVMQQPDIEEDDDALYETRLPTSAIRYTDTRGNQVVQRGKQRIVIHNEPPPPKKRRHWLFFVGLGMVVMVGEDGEDALRENVQMQQEQGVNTRVIGADEVGEGAPGYSGEGVALACYEPETGVADPMATTFCFAQRARDLVRGFLLGNVLPDGARRPAGLAI